MIKLAFSEIRNRPAFAISSGIPKRPNGNRRVISSRSFFVIPPIIGVSVSPGLTALQRTFGASARAKLLFNAIIAPLELT